MSASVSFVPILQSKETSLPSDKPKPSDSLYDMHGWNSKSSRHIRSVDGSNSPLVFFSDGNLGKCHDSKSFSFNTFGFLGFLMGVVNIVGQVSSS